MEKIVKKAIAGDKDAKELVEFDALNPDFILNDYDISVDEDNSPLVNVGRYNETTKELKFVFHSNSSYGSHEMTKITIIYRGKTK